MEFMEIEPATAHDYQGIVDLATRYYIDNLSVEAQKDGFLSVSFNVDQIAEMAEDPGIVVAREAGGIVAFLCGSRHDSANPPPFYPEMLKAMGTISYRGRPLMACRYFFYGPVCIDSRCRRKGLLRKLYHAMLKRVAGSYETGVAFVAATNPRSLNAHLHGLDMEAVGNFEFRGRLNHILVFPVGPPHVCSSG